MCYATTAGNVLQASEGVVGTQKSLGNKKKNRERTKICLLCLFPIYTLGFSSLLAEVAELSGVACSVFRRRESKKFTTVEFERAVIAPRCFYP